jgi:predicted esterase
LDHEQERKILYQRWTTMRLFRPSFAGLKKTISDHKIPVQLIFGKYDRVIVAKHGYRLQKGIDIWVSVTELTAGHHLLQEKYKKDLLMAAEL